MASEEPQQNSSSETGEKEKKGILGNIADSVKSGIKESSDFLKEGADTLVKGLKDSGELLMDGGKLVVGTLADGGKFVVDGGKFVIDGMADGGKVVVDGMADGGKAIADGLAEGGRLVVDGGKLILEGVSDGGQLVIDGVTDSAKFVLFGLSKAGEVVVDQTTGAVGYIKDGIYYVGEKTISGTVIVKDGVLLVGDKVIGSLINTGKFIGDTEYREKVGKPWLKEIVNSNKKILAYQMVQNKKTMYILYRYSLGQKLSEDELQIVKKQLADMIKLVPALAIFLLPGGAILLPMLARMLPWELIPDLKPPEEVQPGEDIKKEENIEIPENLKELRKKNIEEVASSEQFIVPGDEPTGGLSPA